MGSSVASSEDLAMSDVSGAREDKIFVSIRLRPLSDKETARHDLSDWECIDENTLIFRNSLPERSMYPSAYTFDRVFGCDSSTRKVYEEGAKEVALSVVNGINSSIFAYGQTSSGKTYTMSGITAYAVADIYDYIDQQIDREFVMKFSAMEIYNEAVRDLLSSDIAPLRLLDDPERGTVVERLMEETLRDRNHLDELLYICEAQRKIGETSLNETSSRSHQILRLTIESSARDYFRTENSSTLAASVNFIDLAGSERASQTLSAGTRLKEGCHINRSLLTLGTVIRKLSKGRNGHVPYRDSKLTRILQNSLGGNARTAIICTISPARSHVEQSRNTLLFASCAKHVSTNAQVNVLVSDKALVKQLQKELARLESHVRSLESASASGGSSALLREKELQIERMEREIKEVTQQRDFALGRVEQLLRLVGEDKASRVDEYSESGESPDVIDPLYADPSYKTGSKASRNCFDQPIACSSTDQNFQVLPEMTDDNFLLDLSTPKFSGPDPCRGWELIHQRVDDRSLDICKDVQCIEVAKEPRMERVVEADVVALPSPDRNEAKHVTEVPVNEDEMPSSPRKEDQEENLDNGEDATSPSSSPRKEDNNHVRAESFYVDQDMDMHEEDRDDVSATAIPLSSSLKECVEVSNVSTECACEALQQKVENMQKAIKRVLTLNIFEPSPCSKGDVSSCGSNKLARSRSSGVLMAQSSSPLLSEADKDAIAPPSSKEMEILLKKPRQGSRVRSRARREKFCRQDSVLSACLPSEHAKLSEEDIKDVDDIYREFKEMGRSQSQSHSHCHSQSETQFDDNVEGTDYEDAHDEDVEEEEDEFLEEEKNSEPKDDWAKEFQKQRSKIIELWDRCYVPLVHRTYFFTLFNGDPSDSIYLEVELRRLSFLSTSLNRPNQTRSSLTPTRASSIKSLTREREMLSKQMHRKLDRNEREALYKKWGINLNTKQRSLQLANRIWTDPKEVEDSAVLVAKLIQLMEPGRQVPKEMFGLSFSAVPALDRRSMSWKG